MVACPICGKFVREIDINGHLDSGCEAYIETSTPSTQAVAPPPSTAAAGGNAKNSKKNGVDAFFTPSVRRNGSFRDEAAHPPSSSPAPVDSGVSLTKSTKRALEDDEHPVVEDSSSKKPVGAPSGKKQKNSHAPLAERMRPKTLDEVAGQELVGPNGVLRNLILTDRVPSMILWGGPGTGKTTIARLIASTAGSRFVEINSTSSGVGECKKLFAEAKGELALTGRKTIIFCDEIHRFSKSQQDVFLAPVESGQVTLIGATTENPSFKVVNALLSRCRTFTLSKLSDEDVFAILQRALAKEVPDIAATPSAISSPPLSNDNDDPLTTSTNGETAPDPILAQQHHVLTSSDHALLHHLQISRTATPAQPSIFSN